MTRKAQIESAKSSPRIVIRPSHGWGRLDLHEVWEYRELVYFMLWRDLKGRYRQTALGPLWVIIQPLTTMILYSIIFGVVAKLPSEGFPYPIFIYTALLPWSFFAGAAALSANSLVADMHLISKVYYPRLVGPIAAILASLMDFLISFAILLGMMLYYGIMPTWTVLIVPLYLVLAGATGLAIGLWFASWIAHYRDVAKLLGYILQGWMYASPVVYSISVVPNQWRTLYRLNPMVGVVEGFRWALLGTGRPPDWTLLLSAVLAIPVLIFGAYYFRHTERTIVDVI